jgi:hypothetical protein
MKRWHDKRIKIKHFKVGHKIRSKLRSKWEGPYLVNNAIDHGAITLQNDDGNIFKASGQRLKIFLEPEISELEEIDVYELSELEPSSMVIAGP